MARNSWKKTKCQVRSGSYHLAMDHLVTLRDNSRECCNNKTNLMCFFVDFRKKIDVVYKTDLCNILEKLKVPFELIVVPIRLYMKVKLQSLGIMRAGQRKLIVI